jgi:hypothetical protein
LLLQKVLPTIANEARVFHTEAEEAREVDGYMNKLREHRRALKRERREKEQAAQAAAAHAAAAVSSRRGHVKRDGEKGDGDKEGGMGTPGAKKKRGTVRDDDSDDSSCSDDDVLVDHLVGEVANEDDAMCIICGHGDSEVRNSPFSAPRLLDVNAVESGKCKKRMVVVVYGSPVAEEGRWGMLEGAERNRMLREVRHVGAPVVLLHQDHPGGRMAVLAMP